MRSAYRLEVQTVTIEDVAFGREPGLAGHVLTVDPDALSRTILEDDRIEEVSFDVARPGDDVRIVHCLDAVEPRTKVAGSGTVFPGFLGGPETAGEGTTLRLGGMSVLCSATYPQTASGLLTAREAVVDMSGPCAPYSPFSQLVNLVVTYRPNPSVENADFDDAIRRATLALAQTIARSCPGAAVDRTEVFDSSDVDEQLPNIAYFYQVQSQGSMADTYLYGRTVENLVPTLVHPNEVVDGALVSGVHVYATVKNPTYHHQNNPVIWELQRRHGTDLNFVGVILNRGHNYTQEEKERSSQWASKLARLIQADGVVLTTEGGGNSEIDTMLACSFMEKEGIRTALLHYEQPGEDGRAFPLTFTVPEADAFVSLGSINETLAMPEMARVIGGDHLLDGSTPAAGPFESTVLQLYAATSQVGGNVLVGADY